VHDLQHARQLRSIEQVEFVDAVRTERLFKNGVGIVCDAQFCPNVAKAVDFVFE
jgi:hypothetical protein